MKPQATLSPAFPHRIVRLGMDHESSLAELAFEEVHGAATNLLNGRDMG